jgi:20S proteasome alpha/beta subunit
LARNVDGNTIADKRAEGMRLAVDAVRTGIENDLGSGSQVDVCVIGQGGVMTMEQSYGRR